MSVKGFGRHPNGKPHPVHEKSGVKETDMKISEKGASQKIEVKIDPQKKKRDINNDLENGIKIDTLLDGDSEYIGMIDGINVEPVIDNKKIPSKLFVIIRNMKEFVGDEWNNKEGNFDGELVMVPEIKYINKEKLEDALQSSGLKGEVNLSDEAKYESLIGYGAYIRLGNDKVGKSEKELKEKLGKDAYGARGMIGFYLDRNMNAIGTTGWDLLEEFTFGGDAFKKSFDRLKNK